MLDAELGPIAAFSAGFLSFLAPCILPVIPAVAAYCTSGGKYKPLQCVTGISIAFTIFGILLASLGFALSRFLLQIKLITGFIIVLFGLLLIFESASLRNMLPFRIGLVVDPSKASSGILFGFFLGISWIPCTGPILGSILMLVATEGRLANGALLLFIYSLGLALPLLVVAYASNFSTRYISALSKYSQAIRKISGLILILVGVYFIFHEI